MKDRRRSSGWHLHLRAGRVLDQHWVYDREMEERKNEEPSSLSHSWNLFHKTKFILHCGASVKDKRVENVSPSTL